MPGVEDSGKHKIAQPSQEVSEATARALLYRRGPHTYGVAKLGSKLAGALAEYSPQRDSRDHDQREGRDGHLAGYGKAQENTRPRGSNHDGRCMSTTLQYSAPIINVTRKVSEA